MINLELKRDRIATLVLLLLAGIILLVLAPRSVSAQTGAGSVSGTVRDAQQAVIPGAEIIVTNEATNVSRKGTSSAVGAFYFAALPPGPYRVTVELAGFKKWSGTLLLQVGQDAVISPVMEVGEISAVVEVSGASSPIATESAPVSNVKDFERIRDLPLNGRSISNLFNLTPGVEGGGNARVNGLKVGSMEITLDGISLVDRFGGGIARVQPGLDTVQEFRIETVGSDARYSRPATVTLSTRGGTNEFHGSLFETHRNNTAGLVARRRNQSPDVCGENFSDCFPKLIRNEFGASSGGPLWLGSLYDGRDKSFWFFAYEGLRQLQSSETYFTSTPTAAMWNGDLSNTVDSEGTPYIIYDPLTTDANGVRKPFEGNIIPSSRISQFAKTVQALTALPLNDINPHLGSNFDKFYPSILNSDNYTMKGDQRLSSKDQLSARWTISKRHSEVQGGYWGNPSTSQDAYGSSRSDATVNNVSATWTSTLTPRLLSQLMVGVHRSYKSSGTLADFTDWPTKLGFPNPFGVTGWPTFYAYSGPTYFGWDSDNRKDEALTGIVLEENISWTKGNHEIQFGGKIRKEYNNVRELQQAQGSHNFGGEWTALWSPDDGWGLPYTGSGFADLLLGLPDYLSNQYNRGFFYFQQFETGLYFNDKWRVTPRLTLSLGVRWDNWTPYREKYDRLDTADDGTVTTRFEVMTPDSVDIHSLQGIPPSVLDSWSARGLSYTTADAVGYPSKLFSADRNNFGPRLGAAFKINDKTVLRGGYGEYFWTMPLSQILQASRTNPPLNLRFQNDYFVKNADYNYPFVAIPAEGDYIPNATVDTEGIVEIDSRAQSVVVWDGRNWKDSRAQSWHVTLERELMRNTALRLSYIGEHGRDMEQRFALNTQEAEYNYVARTGLAPPSNRALLRANKDWNVNGINRTGFSNTNSAQIEIERRFSEGISFQWFYTYSRSLTTSDAGGFDAGNFGINSASGGGQVPENINLYGEPNLSYDERQRLVYYNSTNVPPHRIRYNAVVELPVGKGKRWLSGVSTALDQVVGGWQFTAIGDWRGGNWLSPDVARYAFGDPRLSADERLTMDIFGTTQRLWFKGDFNPTSATNVSGDLTALVPVDPAQRVLHRLGSNFDNRIAQQLADGTIRQTPIGDVYNFSPRANIMGPGAWNLDLGIYKNFRIKESTYIRFRSDFFNFFNHPNDINPDMITGLQKLNQQSNDARVIQFSLRVDW